MTLQWQFDLFFNEEIHYYGEQAYNYENQVQILMDKQRMDFDYTLQRPSLDFEEILSKFTLESPISVNNTPNAESMTFDAPSLEIIQNGLERASGKKNKKSKKNENSPFHNYQKHLNNALKKLIVVPELETHDGHHKQAAFQIWQAYCRCEIKTKRILHFIFNERNEHAINDSELRTYGLYGIYQRFGEEVVSQARAYLSKLAIDQLDRQNIQGYLQSRKLKSKEGFEEYILCFRAELETGFLKRRLNSDKS